ncbi:exopolyphosphatase, putative [Paenibacillus marchantiophytorum]|uniref:Exopolyphosphatase, putative n=1 Tax=Paenibacillus marchantiophytorum TaxID=1619310 RepID=A0ABQ1FHY4_9BACL|nr:exopolyphosphatase [Paenibacillus marchantiophytorum]GGA12761.1 exopolyphosphatase, putative [Paenibacillus marchantiophytorum]
MQSDKLILDLSSRSAKVFKRSETGIEQVDLLTWELSESKISLPAIEDQLKLLLSANGSIREGLDQGTIEAIGTEAMRRSPLLSQHMQEICENLQIAYRTISQEEEADLLKKAIAESDIPNHLDVLHVGGGGIQMITRDSEAPYMIPFGISDLNQQFQLLESPSHRQIATCIKWLSSRLPVTLKTFAYTGGEKTYVQHFGIELEQDLYCLSSDFTLLARRLAAMELPALEARSPFDPKWMRGVIASNCIVLAGLIKSGSTKFMPSDLNMAHGILNQS